MRGWQRTRANLRAGRAWLRVVAFAERARRASLPPEPQREDCRESATCHCRDVPLPRCDARSCAQVKKACRAYRVYYSRPTPEEVKAGDYLLDHSIISYLLDPEGDTRTTTTTTRHHHPPRARARLAYSALSTALCGLGLCVLEPYSVLQACVLCTESSAIGPWTLRSVCRALVRQSALARPLGRRICRLFWQEPLGERDGGAHAEADC